MENKEVLSVKAAELDEFLSGLKETVPDAPYKLNVEGFTRESVDVLRKYPEIYVDLSETKVADKHIRDMSNYFSDCVNLIAPPLFPRSITSMEHCFIGCKNLIKPPVIPYGVTNMQGAFRDCKMLRKAPIIPESVINMFNCFSWCENLIEPPVIPEKVTNIGYCFSHCLNLTIPPIISESVKNMRSCFYDCRKLKSAPLIPSQVTDLTFCFKNCTDLVTGPVIPNQINNMNCCFEGCSSLIEMPSIPSSVNDLYGCFKNCSKLTTLAFQYNELCIYRDCVDTKNIKTIKTDNPSLLATKLFMQCDFFPKQIASVVQLVDPPFKKSVFDIYFDKIKEAVSAAKNADIDFVLKTGKEMLTSFTSAERNEIHDTFITKGLVSEKKLSDYMKKTMLNHDLEKKKEAYVRER